MNYEVLKLHAAKMWFWNMEKQKRNPDMNYEALKT